MPHSLPSLAKLSLASEKEGHETTYFSSKREFGPKSAQQFHTDALEDDFLELTDSLSSTRQGDLS